MMNKKSLIVCISFTLALVLVFAVCAKPTPTTEKTILLKFAGGSGETSILFKTPKMALSSIEEESMGRVKFEYFPGGTVVQYKDSYDGVLTGLCDITQVSTAYYPGRFPLTEVLDLPPAFVNAKDAVVMADFFRKNLEPTEEWSKAKVLIYMPLGGSQLLCAKNPVRGINDLKGMRVRSMGLDAEVFKILGATPIAMSPSEVYEGLQRGTIDAAYIAAFGLKTLKLAEVCKYSTELAFAVPVNLVIMNREKYDSLPKDIKKLFDSLYDPYAQKHAEGFDEMQDDGRVYLKELGGENINLTPEARAEILKRAMTVNDKWAEEVEAKGLPGKKILKQKYDFMKRYMPEVFK